MAGSVTIEGKSILELEREITCGICQEPYSEPKILPCLHYFCKQCVLKLAYRTGTSKPFSCPECRYVANLPDGGVDELKTAFFINRLKSTLSTMERAHGKVDVKCELCDDCTDHAEAFCRQCVRFICRECENLHKRIATFKLHEIASLDDLKHGRAKPIEVKEPPNKKCVIHEKSLKIYCYDCNRLICQHCTLRDHRDHNFEFSKKAAPVEKAKLLEDIKPLTTIQINLVNVVEQIKAVKIQIEDQKDSAVNIIKTSFKELHDILDKREQELMKEVGTMTQEKVNTLLVQEKALSLANAEVQSVMEYTKRCVRYCTDNEIMSMLTEMRKTIDKTVEQHNKRERKFEPVEEADIEINIKCADELQELCRTHAVASKLVIEPRKCTVYLEEALEVGILSKGTLTARLSNGKQTIKTCNVSSQIKSLYNGVIADCDINDDGAGQYSIHYTPTVRGHHELTVLIGDQHVAGSPFSVFVSIHPTQLGKPVKVWGCLFKPLGITMNSLGELLVTDKNGNIFKFDANAQRQLVLTTNEITLCSIAVDSEDNIYCIAASKNKILTCDKNGDNIEIREIETCKGYGRRALSIINNELFISLFFSKAGHRGIIMVCDRELNHLRSIEHEDLGRITDIASDTRGNLYMTDRTNSCIQVFSADGIHLHSFGHDFDILKYPWSACLCGQYVYVTDDIKHCVSVFTTDGRYVTSFGQRGSGEGDLNSPHYLYIDKDGFVYVNDCCNCRIQCF